MRAAPSAPLPVLALGLLAALFAGCHEVHFEPVAEAGEILVYDDLFAVEPVGDNKVVAAGYWGTIYVSDDAGKSWYKSETPTNRLVYDVSMADATHGWAVGQGGEVLRTEDGGRSWQRQPTPKDDQGVQLFAVEALDAQRAWAVGTWGTRIYTADGGATWEDHSLTIDAEHPQFVWLSISDQERVRRGENVFEDVGLGDIFCLPQNTDRCWIIGEFAYLFRTEDGGKTWERGEIKSGTELPPLELGYDQLEISEEQEEAIREFTRQIASEQHLNIAVESFANEREIEAMGDPEDPYPLFELLDARTQSVVMVVEDEGVATDRIRRRNQPPWDYEDYLEEDPNFLNRFLEGRLREDPQIEVRIAQNPFLFTVRFADANEGWISGLGGVVLRSHDGGRTWRYEEIGRKAALFSVYPFDGEHALIVGEKGLVRETADGGESWREPEDFPSLFTYMRDVKFEPTDRVGYVVGQNGLVLRSEDGGGSWSQVLPPEEREGAGDLAAD